MESLPATIAAWSSGTGTVERVWRQYLLRVAYLSVTRIMLYRSWEDVGFVDEMLYDGGFDTAYERMNENVRDVLRRAFRRERKYKTLFRREQLRVVPAERGRARRHPLQPRRIPLGKLDQDALGELYVSYVDEIDRDRLGQFFTPRDVVRFMLDRAGFAGEDVFRVEGNERLPVEGLRLRDRLGRVPGRGGSPHHRGFGNRAETPRGLQEALRAISSGFYGGEISPFPTT